MDAKKILEIVLREMTAYGHGWRMDWSDFDGRSLKSQLESLAEFADDALKSDKEIDFTDGTDFYEEKMDS